MFGECEHDPFAAPRDRCRLSRLEENPRLRLVPAVAGQPQTSDVKRFGPCHRRNVIGLVEQRARFVEIALQAAHVREMGERDLERDEGASLACQLNASSGQIVPAVVGEQLRRNASGEPRPADADTFPLALLTKREECTF